jgi:hypothetical protein
MYVCIYRCFDAFYTYDEKYDNISITNNTSHNNNNSTNSNPTQTYPEYNYYYSRNFGVPFSGAGFGLLKSKVNILYCTTSNRSTSILHAAIISYFQF